MARNKAVPTTRNRIRAYFSHSYRAEDKHINLAFWDLFSLRNCYFAIDPKTKQNEPMDVTYLEWLMQRSDCFIAVIPRRFEEGSPEGCSPYQIFENGLAIRASKPRLIFAEDGLSRNLFQCDDEEICFYSKADYKDQLLRFKEKVSRLIKKAQINITEPSGAKPITLLLNRKEPYTPEVLEMVESTIDSCGFVSTRSLNPYDRRTFPRDYFYTTYLNTFEVLITEVRPPYIPLDIFAAIHERCLPIIRICHLKESEDAESLASSMRLDYGDPVWRSDQDGLLPILLTGYRLDKMMRPIIFWRDPKELVAQIKSCLKKIQTNRDTEILYSAQKARRYFLPIGLHNPGKVFISNPKSLNWLGMELRSDLDDWDIQAFQYRDPEAIRVGKGDWSRSIHDEIDKAEIFIALFNTDYKNSENCMDEFQYALPRFKLGELDIYIYVPDETEIPKKNFGKIQARYLQDYGEDPKVWLERIIGNVVEYFEKPEEERKKRQPLEEETVDVNLVYVDDTGQLGTFRGIENGGLLGIEAESGNLLSSEIFNVTRLAAAETREWQTIIDAIGKELYLNIFQKQSKLKSMYDEKVTQSGVQKRLVRISIATDRNGFVIPFEWMRATEDGRPICLEHPVRRFLAGSPLARPALRRVSVKNWRILLIGANTHKIPQVLDEVKDLKKLFLEQWGLPEGNVDMFIDEEATPERVEKAIISGGHHILHFAGHSETGEEGSSLFIFKDSINRGIFRLTPAILKDWISKSNLRFVYLSSCRSGEIIYLGETSPRVRFQPIQDILQAVLEARVPEIVGFYWPISDLDTRIAAKNFYENYFPSMEASSALLAMRRSLSSSQSQIWAAPVLVQQF